MSIGLPKGVWYDAKRKRYRVRLYHYSTVIYRKYAASLDEALRLYKEALKLQKRIREKQDEPLGPLDPKLMLEQS